MEYTKDENPRTYALCSRRVSNVYINKKKKIIEILIGKYKIINFIVLRHPSSFLRPIDPGSNVRCTKKYKNSNNITVCEQYVTTNLRGNHERDNVKPGTPKYPIVVNSNWTTLSPKSQPPSLDVTRKPFTVFSSISVLDQSPLRRKW